jgi:hypothetical protein
MDFIKKHWANILIAATLFAAAILMIVPVFTAPAFHFVGACQIIGVIVFALGMMAVYIMKMVEVKKIVSAITLLSVGLLSLIFLTVGAFGFSYTDKSFAKAGLKAANGDFSGLAAYGAFGNAYIHFDTSAEEAKEMPEDGLDALKVKLGNINGLIDGLNGLPGTITTVNDIPHSNTTSSSYALYMALTLPLYSPSGPAGLGVSPTATIEVAKATVAGAKTQLKKGIELREDSIAMMNTAKTTLLLTYISMLLILGLVPTLKGGKKLVCALCHKCCEQPKVGA